MTLSHPPPTLGLALLLRTLRDFVKGLSVFHVIGPCVTVFGSARIGREADVYGTALSLGVALSGAGFAVMTGGGPGLMEAVSRGAKAGGGCSLGCRMRLDFEQVPNAYLDRSVTFRYFFVRKVMLCRHACAFVALPGGLGTLDELFEVLTLVQTKKIQPVPVVLFGTEYWGPLLVVLRRMATRGMLTEGDLGMIHLTDEVEDVIAHIKARVPASAVPREAPPLPHPLAG